MDRPIIQAGEGLRAADFLNGAKGAFVGLAKLCAAVFGTSTVVNGLACTPGTGLTVSIGAGEIYTLAATDTAAYGTLTSDSHQIMKQGVVLDPTVLATPAPGTGGQSINYLIEAQFQETDAGSANAPFYDTAHPTVPSFSNINTLRKDICALQVKAGTAAATGSQTTPAPDAGWTPLWVVTIANGAVSVVTGNIAQHPSAPYMLANLVTLPALAQLYARTVRFYAAGGTANALTATTTPVTTAWFDGLLFGFKPTATNTGAATMDLGAGAKALRRFDGTALKQGDLQSGDSFLAIYDVTLDHCRIIGFTRSQLAEKTDYYTAGGTANAITITPAPAQTAYINGQVFTVKIASNNTAAVTLDAGPGAKPLRSSVDANLQTGDLIAGERIMAMYDAASDRFQLLDPVPSEWAGPGLTTDTTGGLKVNITGQTSKAAQGADEVMVWDTSLNALRKVSVNSIAGVAAFADDLIGDELFLGMM
jgi:hypothetical protein